MTNEPLFDLIGGLAIRNFLFGDKVTMRQFYRIKDTTRMPIINDGGRLMANSKTLTRWKRERELEVLLGQDKQRATKKLQMELQQAGAYGVAEKALAPAE
jgi:hypothetical protein